MAVLAGGVDPLGPYSRTLSRPLWWPYGGLLFLMSEVALYLAAVLVERVAVLAGVPTLLQLAVVQLLFARRELPVRLLLRRGRYSYERGTLTRQQRAASPWTRILYVYSSRPLASLHCRGRQEDSPSRAQLVVARLL